LPVSRFDFDPYITEERTVPSLIKTAPDEVRRLMNIRHSRKKPEDAFIAVNIEITGSGLMIETLNPGGFLLI
jgi:hypothetical protein